MHKMTEDLAYRLVASRHACFSEEIYSRLAAMGCALSPGLNEMSDGPTTLRLISLPIYNKLIGLGTPSLCQPPDLSSGTLLPSHPLSCEIRCIQGDMVEALRPA